MLGRITAVRELLYVWFTVVGNPRPCVEFRIQVLSCCTVGARWNFNAIHQKFVGGGAYGSGRRIRKPTNLITMALSIALNQRDILISNWSIFDTSQIYDLWFQQIFLTRYKLIIIWTVRNSLKLNTIISLRIWPARFKQLAIHVHGGGCVWSGMHKWDFCYDRAEPSRAV